VNTPPRTSILAALLGAFVLGAIGCGADTGRDVVEVPIHGAGTAVGPFAVGAWTVTLSEAELGFGAVYFCASASGTPDLCETALLDYTAAFTIDALDPTIVMQGQMPGVTGTIRSALFDYAIAWWPTLVDPTPEEGAPGGHSARIAGSATDGMTTFDFVAEVDVLPRVRGSQAVVGAHTDHELMSSDDALVVRVDPRPWLAAVDFDALAAMVVDPAVPVVIAPGTQAYDAIVFQLTTNALPTFAWGSP